MLLTILIAAQAANITPAPAFVPGTFTKCVSTKVQRAEARAVAHVTPRTAPRARATPLAELPSGGLHLTVVRTVGGCQVPTLIKEGYGFIPATPREDRLKQR